ESALDSQHRSGSDAPSVQRSEDSASKSSNAATKKRSRRPPAALQKLDDSTLSSASISLARLLPLQNPAELKSANAKLSELTSVSIPEVRQGARASLVLADDSFDGQWRQVSKSESAFIDLLEAIPMLPDQDFRAKAFDQTKALLDSGGGSVAGSGNSEVIKAAAIHALVSMHR